MFHDPDAVVATVYINSEVYQNDTSIFIESLLSSIFSQIRGKGIWRQHVAHDPLDDPTCIGRVSKALHEHAKGRDRIFLIIDGIDRCCAEAEHLLQSELTSLQSLGVHIMTTSRVRCCEELTEPGRGCDSDSCGRKSWETHPMYWTCKGCHRAFDLCFPCKTKGEQCANW